MTLPVREASIDTLPEYSLLLEAMATFRDVHYGWAN
jgi:hypothetical protein